MIKYIGVQYKNCDMCIKYVGNHAYEFELLLKDLYPKGYNTRLIICESCAKRETGKKLWQKINRKKGDK